MRFHEQVSLFVKGKEIPPPVDESIRLFSLCEAMKWSHLPSPGAIFDQKAGLMDRFYFIFAQRAEHEERERKKEEQKNKRTMGRR